MNGLMEKWKAQWTEAEEQIKALGKLRTDLLETEAEIRQALTNRNRMVQTHGYDGKTAPRFDLAVEAAFGKREQLPKSLSEEAEYEAANVLAERGAK
jgi:hypothetical protein